MMTRIKQLTAWQALEHMHSCHRYRSTNTHYDDDITYSSAFIILPIIVIGTVRNGDTD